MQKYKIDFIKFALNKGVLKFGEFTLKSGRISPYFFNAGLFNTGYDLFRLGQFYAETIVANNLSFDLIFGPAYKGIPLATTTAVSLARDFSLDKPYCFNRKEEKDHGEGGNLVGSELRGDILLVDDVITAGTAIKESYRLITMYPAKLKYIVIALDRQERGNSMQSAIQEVSTNFDCDVFSIIQLQDLMAFISNENEYAAFLPKLEAYRQKYGIIL